jgi:C1A family cysteine protease
MYMSTKINKRSPEWYGWLPDLPDHRDLLYAALAPKLARLPEKVDLRKRCSPIESQGRLGSCTANALAGALEFLELKHGGEFVDLSRLFIYYNERVIEGTVHSDSGAFLRDGIKTLAKQGVCSEHDWPYKIRYFRRKPGKACYRSAEQHRIVSYHRIKDVDEMRTCLAEGYPFVFGFTVYSSFESKKIEKSGILNMPEPDEKVMGGHAVMAAGYDDRTECFLIRNSWGRDWGKHGYFSMPYDYLADRDLSDDFWTIRAAQEA